MYDPFYLLVLIASLVLGLGTQAYINRQYSKYMKIPISSGFTGAQAARRMLDANGLGGIPIQAVAGKLVDNFNPKTGVISLSEDVFNSYSVSATAIACHECGHAIQHASGYAPVRIRTAIFPVVSVVSNLWIVVLMIGAMLAIVELIWAAVIMYAIVLLFQLVTLPVEFNASSRAIAFIGMSGYLPDPELQGARRVLRAAALTYVAGALVSLLNLLRFINMANRRR
ncbi:MAG: zinc metallopeptidase [Coriobacteriia bacterium]|nr:zinc metallopeptidase [Coriobacteriia bacterium]